MYLQYVGTSCQVPGRDAIGQGGVVDAWAVLPRSDGMGSMGHVKTTIDIQDALLERAKRYAKRSHRPLRAVVEDGLRRVLTEAPQQRAYQLPDASVGDPEAPDPLEVMSWQDLRAEIYGDPSSR